jgi:flagellar basal body-associated protein FliL
MAEKHDDLEQRDLAEGPQAPEPAKKRRALKTHQIAVLVVGIMATEGLLGWWAISRSQSASASDATQAADSLPDPQADEHADTKVAPPETLALKEVEIGAFQLSRQAEGGINIHVQLGLSATVPEKLAEEFRKLSAEHQSRIRQSVLSIIRSSSREDLADPSLNLIRRKIQDQLNRLLEKSYLADVVVTEISIIGQ